MAHAQLHLFSKFWSGIIKIGSDPEYQGHFYFISRNILIVTSTQPINEQPNYNRYDLSESKNTKFRIETATNTLYFSFDNSKVRFKVDDINQEHPKFNSMIEYLVNELGFEEGMEDEDSDRGLSPAVTPEPNDWEPDLSND